MLHTLCRSSALSRRLPASLHLRPIAARHPHLTASFSGIEGQSHSDPLIPHPLPSPHTPPATQPPSTAPRDESDRRQQHRAQQDRTHVAEHDRARLMEALVDVVEATAEEGRREVDPKVAAAMELLSMGQAEKDRGARLQAEAVSKRDSNKRADEAFWAEQSRRQQAEKEKREAKDRQQRAVEAQQRAERLAEEDKKAAAARAEQARLEEQKRAERRRQHQMQQQQQQQRQQQASATTTQSSKVSARSQEDEQLRIKQEKERAERARWLAAQPKASTASTPTTAAAPTATPSTRATSSPPSATSPQSATTRPQDTRRKEEPVSRDARTREQELERERAARQAQQQQAAQQQAAALAVKQSFDKQKTLAQAAAAEEDRKQKAAILQQQQEAERKRQEALNAAQEKQRKLEAASREEAERKANVQRAEKRKLDEAVQKQQQQQQAALLAALQKDHLPSSAEFSSDGKGKGYSKAEEQKQQQAAITQLKPNKLDAASREEAHSKQTKVDATVQKQQQFQQASLLAALQKDHLPSHTEFSSHPARPAARATVVLTPGAPPPSIGGPGGGSVVVATPGPEIVMRTERPEERVEREGRQGAWLPYVLMGAGGGLVVLYALMRKREKDESTRITAITTEHVLPAQPAQQKEELPIRLPQTQSTAPVMDPLPVLVSHPIPPPPLPPLSAPLPLPTVDESAFPDLSKTASASAAAAAAPTSSAEPLSSLNSLLDSLQTVQLQELLASLAQLETDEAHYLRKHVQSALSRHFSELQSQVAELSSGVSVSVDAPLLSHSGDTDKAKMSVEELEKYLASLQRQYDTLTHGGTALSVNTTRATREVERQMEALFSPLLTEQRQHAEQLISQILSVERSLTHSALARQSEASISASVARAIHEEQERWMDVERSELHAQRNDLLALTRLYLLRQRAEMDRVHDAVRHRRMSEWRQVSRRMRVLLDAFSRLVRDTAVSERLHAVALAALTLESIEREEDLEDEEDKGRVRTENGSSSRPNVTAAERAEEWQRLWRLRSEDVVIDAAVSALPSHVLELGVESSKELKRQWRRVQSAMKEEAFVPKSADEAESGRSVWRQLAGKFFSLLYLSPSTVAAAASSGADEIEVLDRMNACVANRRWPEALRLQQQLTENNQRMSARWRQAVEDRMLVEQTLDTVRARIICISLDV